MIAFAGDTDFNTAAFNGDIFLWSDPTKDPVNLTKSDAVDVAPDWFPDAGRIVFASGRTGNGDLYSMNVDGSGLKRLTTHTRTDNQPTVSPDGRSIAFTSDRDGDFDVYRMSVATLAVTQLTNSPGDDYNPDWSPDGSKIAFTSARTGDLDVFTMNADGSNEVNRSDDPTAHDFGPTWSPDGAKLMFSAVTDRDSDVWVMAATGGVQTPVRSTPDDEADVDWQSVPGYPFVDALTSTFKADIQWVFDREITTGCGPERYCPNDPVTREQMAIFLDRALHLPATTTDYFSDDTGRTGEAAINRVAAARITSGCATGEYCPTDKVTRGAMASFLARAFALPSTATDFFSDDDGTTHESNINKIAAAGITSGCTPTTYCPSADVTRGQMAAFLRRALED
jgi:dipeptidyl aminopeptidase/acylaminoacyl peptidase